MPIEMADDLSNYVGHCLWQGGFRRRDAVALGGHLTAEDVDRRPLDPAAANVNAQYVHDASPLDLLNLAVGS
jgi:hypothetical protein